MEIKDKQFVRLSNGIRLHYASTGDVGRPLILFAHGFPEFWYEWSQQLSEFGKDYYAVAPDLRGFNLSDSPSELGAFKARHIVEDLRLLAQELGYQQFILVAHDWGGAIAWNLAIAHPECLRMLVIINSPHPYIFMHALATDPTQQAASAYMNWLRAPDAEEALALDHFARMDGLFTGSGQPEAHWYTQDVRELYHACWRRGVRGGLNYYRASPLHPPVPGHPGPAALALNPDDFRVRVPTRIIWGEQDIALPKSLLDGLEQYVPDIQIERIPEGTHWVIHEQPERVNGLIRRFVAELAP